MTHGRSVLLGIPSGAKHREAVAAAVEFARLLRLPLTGIFVEDQGLLDLLNLPAAFVPLSAGPPAPALDARFMQAALHGEGRRFRAELELRALGARIECTVSVRRGALIDALLGEVGPGDLVVMSLDLSRRSLAEIMPLVRRLRGHARGVLLTPEVRPSRRGAIVAVANAGRPASFALAADIAARTPAPLLALAADPEGVDLEALRGDIAARLGGHAPFDLRILPAGRNLEAAILGASGIRSIVTEPGTLERIGLDAPDAPIRRFRPALLILRDEAEGGSPGD
ncbi:MAG TPA: hypothetical protein VFR34_14240 [Paracoccaceae bacterium]|nr:hypothetical protein [Paracoccaceae bacterium]